MFLPSSYEVTEGIPPARKPFSHLTVFAQQLHRSGLHSGCTVQDASNNVATYLSHMELEGGRVTGKFNFGVDMEERVGGSGGPQVGEATRLLLQPGSKYPLEFSEFS